MPESKTLVSILKVIVAGKHLILRQYCFMGIKKPALQFSNLFRASPDEASRHEVIMQAGTIWEKKKPAVAKAMAGEVILSVQSPQPVGYQPTKPVSKKYYTNKNYPKNKKPAIAEAMAGEVGKTGFEPATPWSQTRCATGLRYFPEQKTAVNQRLSGTQR